MGFFYFVLHGVALNITIRHTKKPLISQWFTLRSDVLLSQGVPPTTISAILRATMSGGFPRQLQACGAHVQSTFRSSAFCFLELLAPPGSPGVLSFLKFTVIFN